MIEKNSINIDKTTPSSKSKSIDVTFQRFGQVLHTAPIVVVIHALTGNADVASETGWWKTIIGKGKAIDTEKYTVIGFNIPGNGYDGNLIANYKDYTARDIARMFIDTLKRMNIESVFATIGGSLGGGIAWEMAALAPTLMEFLIPIASDWKSTDWIIGHNCVQESILNNSANPLHDARMMAMLFYRTPQSLGARFNRTQTENGDCFNIESWLNYHGQRLTERFQLSAYKMMNHLLSTIDIAREKSFYEVVKPIEATIIQVGIDTDLFFVAEENIKTKRVLDRLGVENLYHEIKSIHGHDAFLMEYEQLETILKPIFLNEELEVGS